VRQCAGERFVDLEAHTPVPAHLDRPASLERVAAPSWDDDRERVRPAPLVRRQVSHDGGDVALVQVALQAFRVMESVDLDADRSVTVLRDGVGGSGTAPVPGAVPRESGRQSEAATAATPTTGARPVRAAAARSPRRPGRVRPDVGVQILAVGEQEPGEFPVLGLARELGHGPKLDSTVIRAIRLPVEPRRSRTAPMRAIS